MGLAVAKAVQGVRAVRVSGSSCYAQEADSLSGVCPCACHLPVLALRGERQSLSH